MPLAGPFQSTKKGFASLKIILHIKDKSEMKKSISMEGQLTDIRI